MVYHLEEGHCSRITSIEFKGYLQHKGLVLRLLENPLLLNDINEKDIHGYYESARDDATTGGVSLIDVHDDNITWDDEDGERSSGSATSRSSRSSMSISSGSTTSSGSSSSSDESSEDELLRRLRSSPREASPWQIERINHDLHVYGVSGHCYLWSSLSKWVAFCRLT